MMSLCWSSLYVPLCFLLPRLWSSWLRSDPFLSYCQEPIFFL